MLERIYDTLRSPLQRYTYSPTCTVADSFIKIDFEKVAKDYGYKDANLARQKFNNAKRKCKASGDDDKTSVTDGSTKKRKATGDGKISSAKSEAKPKKAKTKAMNGKSKEDEVEDEEEKPVKKEEHDHASNGQGMENSSEAEEAESADEED